ncbi:S66 family peptidase [Oceanivirga salmonicida]|uniref:S66 family peptidase n=1 Tax=Oceanivirga salmonicida TaxID=1769291 RepID=UPI0012E1D353|nr:S66 peptidase family protein [Oceanivirga salmonicida]
MEKDKIIKLNKGDKIAIVSLSSGMLGEKFCSHQIKLGVKRLKELGLEPVFMKNSLKGIKALEENPMLKVQDLIEAFSDKSIKGVITAIGGVDAHKIIPYILENVEYMNILKNNKKFFMGYSDTTTNHLLLHKLGINTFYGLSFLTDFAELDREMLEYTKKSFDNIFTNKEFRYKSSDIWYEERNDFSEKQINIPRISHNEKRSFELIKGNEVFSGKLMGGCVESLNEYIIGTRYSEVVEINNKYKIVPKDNKNKIIFLETSENKISPDELKEMLIGFREYGLFEEINGILIGKPQDEIYYEEYKKVYLEVLKNYDISIVYNVNFGHAYPKILLQYDANCIVDMNKKEIIVDRI